MADVETKATENDNAQTQPTTPETETKNQKPEDNKPVEQEKKEKEPSVQELMVELARMKRAVDKASSEAAEYKKKYNSTLSEKELVDQEKAEAEAKQKDEFESMKRKLQINDYSKQYIAMGYSPEDAEKVATAQADGDIEAMFRLQKDFQTQHDKSIEDAVTKKIYEHPERINAGVNNEKAKDPFLEGFLGN